MGIKKLYGFTDNYSDTHGFKIIDAFNNSNYWHRYYYYNYASHSFDQRILTRKNGGVLYTDLGDAYPRGIHLRESGAGGINVLPFHFNGELGDNRTNSRLGDVVELSTGYMIVGASCKSLNSLNGKRQLFIQIIDPVNGKSLLKASNRKGTSCSTPATDTGVKWLTNYTDGSYVYNVQSAGAEGDRVVIVWERASKNDKKIGTYYMIVSASGTILQNVTRIGKNGEIGLNETEELKYNKGFVYWSTCNTSTSKQHSIMTYKLNVSPGMGVIPDEVILKNVKKSNKGITVSWNKAKNATQYYIYRKPGAGGKWQRIAVTKSLTFTDSTAKKGNVYYYTVKGYNTNHKVFGDWNATGVKVD